MPFQPERCKPDVLDRFWTHVDRSGTCWTWTANKNKDGYGQFTAYTGYKAKAHRFIDHALNGPHKPGEFTLHKCDNPSCVRPSHLFRGTNADNMLDMYQKGREHKRGERNGRARLTEADVTEIRQLIDRGAKREAIADEYGVTAMQIWRIATRKSWRHVA